MTEEGNESQYALSHEEKLAVEFDPRLADVWLSVFQAGTDSPQLSQQLGWFLRMAYLQGYEDALSEPERGALFRRLGLKPPSRQPAKSRRVKR